MMVLSQGSHPNLGRSGMLPTPKDSSTIPFTLRFARLPYAVRGSRPGMTGTLMTLVSSLKRGLYTPFTCIRCVQEFDHIADIPVQQMFTEATPNTSLQCPGAHEGTEHR